MKTKTKKSAPKAARKFKSRLKRNFPMTFPRRQFTLSELRKENPKFPYITAYVRVKNALQDGTLKKVGKQAPEKSRQGRQEILFKLASLVRKHVAAKRTVAKTPRTAAVPVMGVHVVSGVNVDARGQPVLAA